VIALRISKNGAERAVSIPKRRFHAGFSAVARMLAALLVLASSVGAQQVITTFAGSDFVFSGDGQPGVNVALAQPTSLAFDASGNLYITDFTLNTLLKLNPSGVVSVVAGNGLNGSAGDGGLARSAVLGSPAGVAIDAAANIYVVEEDAALIRKITPDGNISTIAGNSQPGFSGDGGPALHATLNVPSALAIDSQGNLYVYSTNGPRIRKIDTAGIITTIAGNGQGGNSGNGGPATSAELGGGTDGGLTVDSQGNLYIADLPICQVRRVDATTGIITAFAGTGGCGSGGDNGPALQAQLNQPSGVVFDAQGNRYISELIGNRVRRVDRNGIITTVAGIGNIGFGGDGGSATQALFSAPRSVAVDPSGNVWVADRDNQRVREFQVGGNIATAVGIGASLGDGGPASGAKLLGAFSVARDGNGNVYIGDFDNSRIRKVSLGGTVSTIAGTGRTGSPPTERSKP
jgi:trimeric autotransporter adhesin